jgi:hypothetical protein
VATTNALPIRYESRNGIVVVRPNDEDRFALAVEAAYCGSCPLFQDRALFRAQFERTLQKLARWLTAHKRQIVQARVTLRGTTLQFLVMHKAKRYDTAFQDQLSELDIAIAQDPKLHLIRLASFAVPCRPWGELASFDHSGLNLVFQHA